MTAVPSIDVRTGQVVAEVTETSDPATVDAVCLAARAAAPSLDGLGRAGRAALLHDLADELAGDQAGLVAVADRETGLGQSRLTGELTRTCYQLRFFAEVLTEGSYLEATIDPPAETPMGPRPDLRRMLVPLGPVAVFGAGNFPLAFGVPGGDTASALAAGCPVVNKAHPGHPETAIRCHDALVRVVTRHGLPAATAGLVHGLDAGAGLVAHPAVTAVGFTGSLAGARALQAVMAERAEPIPLYGELGSVNPVLATSGAAAADPEGLAAGFVASFTLGTGQFCTKPGVLLVPTGADGDRLVAHAAELVDSGQPGTLLGAGVRDGFHQRSRRWREDPCTTVLAEGRFPDGPGFQAAPLLFGVDAGELSDTLLAECFGPAAIIARYADPDQAVDAIRRLGGQLTVTIRAAADEAELTARLAGVLRAAAGRLLFDGFPTGVAVSWAQQHGGPFPATTAVGHTSVGAASIRRWLRPVTYQSAPAAVLPVELRDGNPAGIPRRVDGRWETVGEAD
ncbi:aldehyde dehydrogenase (NADP(+)) [Solwaraspora sp. WMMB335]|uniref:aldehyde dehydrogenase (NADP(+)) n=1 Tax=Solwaraspora sp. WMMB335 TaxID=3404118 RepID=UPI003B95417F